MPRALTDAQREVLHLLQRRGYTAGELVQARELFGRHSTADRGHRRALESLCRAGVLDHAAGTGEVPTWASGVYRIQADTYRALEQDRGLSW